MHVRHAITALGAIAAFAALVGSASARNLSVSNQNFRVTWSSLELTSSGVVIRCSITLEGSFHSRTISKSIGSLVGYVTRAASKNEACTNGKKWFYNGTERLAGSTLANSLPWHLTYEGFEGTLPDITSLRLLFTGMRMLLEITSLGLRCIYTTGARGNVTGTARVATGPSRIIDNLRVSGSITPNAESPSGGFCPTDTLSSRVEDGLVRLLNSSNTISITLI